MGRQHSFENSSYVRTIQVTIGSQAPPTSFLSYEGLCGAISFRPSGPILSSRCNSTRMPHVSQNHVHTSTHLRSHACINASHGSYLKDAPRGTTRHSTAPHSTAPAARTAQWHRTALHRMPSHHIDITPHHNAQHHSASHSTTPPASYHTGRVDGQ